jgi:DNA mismatch repair protein MutS
MGDNQLFTEPFSLLWPDPGQKSGQWLPKETRHDLGLDRLAQALNAHTQYRQEIADILAFLPDNEETIQFRQDVLADLQNQPGLADMLRELLPKIEALEYFNTSLSVPTHQPAIYEVTSRAGELELLVECTGRLNAGLHDLEGDLQSEGLIRLAHIINRVEGDQRYQQLKAELPDLLKELRSAASVTIGVNLDAQLRPMSATLLSVNQHTYHGSDLLDRLLGIRKNGKAGIAPLYTLQEAKEGRGPFDFGPDPLLAKLFQDLSDVLDKTARPVAQTLKNYISFNSRFLAGLRSELTFYLGALNLSEMMSAAGYPVGRPEIAARAERVCEAEAACNINLALHLVAQEQASELVLNDVNMTEKARIFILTGPNQGGKTVYLQMVGLLQILAQSGLFVPARRARISPVDTIFTHYPLEERLDLGTGRLGDEAKRLSDLFDQATRSSLVLLNESLASTSPGESLYLAQDVVAALRRMGVRAVFTTHLHELAEAVEQINVEKPGDSRVGSLVASPSQHTDHAQRTYRVVEQPPMGRSYAREIAERYGISYGQLLERIERREGSEQSS